MAQLTGEPNKHARRDYVFRAATGLRRNQRDRFSRALQGGQPGRVAHLHETTLPRRSQGHTPDKTHMQRYASQFAADRQMYM